MAKKLAIYSRSGQVKRLRGGRMVALGLAIIILVPAGLALGASKAQLANLARALDDGADKLRDGEATYILSCTLMNALGRQMCAELPNGKHFGGTGGVPKIEADQPKIEAGNSNPPYNGPIAGPDFHTGETGNGGSASGVPVGEDRAEYLA